MKLLQTLSLSLALAASVTTAFADDAKKPAPADKAPPKADVDKYLAFFDKLVDTIVADKDDCKKVAADVNKMLDDNTALLKMAADAQAAGMKLPKEAVDHMVEGSKRMMPTMQKCGKDADVNKAFQRMSMKPKKG